MNPVLPPALRETEITGADAEALFKIAADKNAPAGRLKRPTASLPAVTSLSENPALAELRQSFLRQQAEIAAYRARVDAELAEAASGDDQ